MSITTTNISNFIAKIHLERSGVFGVKKITLLVTPSFKITNVESNFKNNLPFKKGDVLDVELFTKWAIKNHYNFSFTTKNSKLKRDLYFYFDNLIIKSEVIKKKSISSFFGFNKVVNEII
jgi:hypothetical protein